MVGESTVCSSVVESRDSRRVGLSKAIDGSKVQRRSHPCVACIHKCSTLGEDLASDGSRALSAHRSISAAIAVEKGSIQVAQRGQEEREPKGGGRRAQP